MYWWCAKRDIFNAGCITNNVNLEEGILVEKAGRHGSSSLLKELHDNDLVIDQLLGEYVDVRHPIKSHAKFTT